MNGTNSFQNADGDKKMSYIYIILTISLLFVCGIGQNCDAYDNDYTHPFVNRRAAKESKTDSVLRNSLDFPNGIISEVNGKSIQEWIADGGKNEGEPSWRCLRHFHDPLKDWNEAGLFSSYRSSILWAQTPEAGNAYGLDNEYSWQIAKAYYYQALLTRAEEYYAKTFRSFCGRLKDIDTLRRDVWSKWLSERTRLYAKKMGPDCDSGIGSSGSSRHYSEVWTVLRKGCGCRDR
jgi:hypothetical protein